MKNHNLGTRSLKNLRGVHPHLVKIVKRAIKISSIDFTVIEGCRTLVRQKALKASGASKTLRSRHIIARNGYGHAVDICPWVNGGIDWNDYAKFVQVGHAMLVAADQLGFKLTWGAGKQYGGHWSNSFNDMPHYQLPWKEYPR